MERLRAVSAAQQAARAEQAAHLKSTGSSGYGAQSPTSSAPKADWLRSRQAEQRALTTTVTATLRAWPGPGENPVFGHVAEVFSFIDADGQGGISEFELSKGLRLLGLGNIDAAQLITAIDPLNRGAGTLTARDFMKSFYFDNDGGRSKMFATMDEGLQKQKHLDAILLEAVIKRRRILSGVNKALHKQSSAERLANQQRLVQQTSEINAAHDAALSKLQQELQLAGFANPSEAYCFFDADGGKSSVVSHVDLVVGLRRLKIDHIFDLDVLQWALEGGGMRDNACMYSEWMRNVAWGEYRGQGIVAENAALDEANQQRRLIKRRILAGVKERERQRVAAEAEAAKAQDAEEMGSEKPLDIDETEAILSRLETGTGDDTASGNFSASKHAAIRTEDTSTNDSAPCRPQVASGLRASLDQDASMVVQGGPDLPLGGAKDEKEPLTYRWFPDPSFCADVPALSATSLSQQRNRPHSAKPTSNARPLSASSQQRGGRPRPASAASATNRSRTSARDPLLSRGFADNSKDWALLERSWKADFWITDQKAPGMRGSRCGWQMPARPLSADLGTTIRKPPRPRSARPQSALGARDWTAAERRRAEAAQHKLVQNEESVGRLEGKIVRARQDAKERFGETDWDVFMPGKFAPQAGFNGVPMPGEKVSSKLPEKPDRQKELQKAAFDLEDAETELQKAHESLELLERMGVTQEELMEGRNRVLQATSDVAAYKAVAAQKKIEVLAEEAEYNAATEAAFEMTTFSDPLKPPKIVIPEMDKQKQMREDAQKTVWVGQIPDELARTPAEIEQMLRDSLGSHGSIDSITVRLKHDVKKKDRSWAVVTFVEAASCESVVKMGIVLNHPDGGQAALDVRHYDAEYELSTRKSDGALQSIAAAQHAALRNLQGTQASQPTVTKPRKSQYRGQTSLKAKDLKATRRHVARLQNRCVGILQNLELYSMDHPEMMLAGLEALDCLISHSPSEATVALQQVAAGRRLTKLLSRHARLPLVSLVQNVEERIATDLARKQKIEEAKQARLAAEEVGRRLAEQADKASRQWNRRVERQAAGLDSDDDEDEDAAGLAANEIQRKRERAAENQRNVDEERCKEEDKESQLSDATPEERAEMEREDAHILGRELLYRLAHKGKRAANHVGRGNDGLAEGLAQVQICVPRKPTIELADAMFKWDGLVGTAVAASAKKVFGAIETEEEKRAKALAAEQAAAEQAAKDKEAEEQARASERKRRLQAKKKAIAAARALEENQKKRLSTQ